jgi:hypothetical protein
MHWFHFSLKQSITKLLAQNFCEKIKGEDAGVRLSYWLRFNQNGKSSKPICFRIDTTTLYGDPSSKGNFITFWDWKVEFELLHKITSFSREDLHAANMHPEQQGLIKNSRAFSNCTTTALPATTLAGECCQGLSLAPAGRHQQGLYALLIRSLLVGITRF